MQRLLLITFLSILFFSKLSAQTYTTSGGAIPNGGPQVAFPVTVMNLSQPINSSYGLESVCVNINHTRVSDLAIKLKSPDGMIVNLALHHGGFGDNYSNTCFKVGAPDKIYYSSAPFTGTYDPIGALGNVNNGQNGNGTWELLVEDIGSVDSGTLIDFSLVFGSNPSLPYSFTSSNLPIVVINTEGVTLLNEVKRRARIGIIYNGVGMINHITDPHNHYNGWAMTEYRGSSTSLYPQKSYSLETCDAQENETVVSLLSMPEESDWVLIGGYMDLSLMRHALTYELCNQMGSYASRTRFCEVVVDGQYQGVYILGEKIKRDPNRINIAKLTPQDISGDDVTGGYIIKIDKNNGTWNGGWDSPYPTLDGNGTQFITFQYHYPKQNDRQPEQESYIKGYIDSFENALASPGFTDTNVGYRHFADMNSFIDNFIINEISRNIDGYRLSYFFYKDKNSNGGKLKSGPAWDYNMAWENSINCNGNADTGWAYRFGLDCPDDGWQVPFWWERMLEDANYVNALKCRWTELRATTLSNENIFDLIDNNAAYLNEAQLRHYARWPINTTYDEIITKMKDWITLRMTWLDANMPGYCSTITHETIKPQNSLSIYPNPFVEDIKLDFSADSDGDLSIEVYSSVGHLVYSKVHTYTTGQNHYKLAIGDQLSAGVYLLRMKSKTHSSVTRMIKQAK